MRSLKTWLQGKDQAKLFTKDFISMIPLARKQQFKYLNTSMSIKRNTNKTKALIKLMLKMRKAEIDIL